VSQEYRAELFPEGKKFDEYDGDDDDAIPLPPLAAQIIPLAILIGLAIGWYAKRLERRRSGYHKKVDEFVHVFNGV